MENSKLSASKKVMGAVNLVDRWNKLPMDTRFETKKEHRGRNLEMLCCYNLIKVWKWGVFYRYNPT